MRGGSDKAGQRATGTHRVLLGGRGEEQQAAVGEHGDAAAGQQQVRLVRVGAVLAARAEDVDAAAEVDAALREAQDLLPGGLVLVVRPHDAVAAHRARQAAPR